MTPQGTTAERPPSAHRRQPTVVAVPWWRRAVFYQIYPRSFADSDGDGIGDLNGIRAHLPDLAWLGVDALWLSPFYPSPMADFGYDVTDYCDVDPLFGTLADFDALLDDAHRLGLKVIIDWVPNHSSDRHPWFVDARSSAGQPRTGTGTSGATAAPTAGRPTTGCPPSTCPGPAWTLDEATGQWYLHLFEPAQPDLNWDEPAVEAAMHDVLRFWLDRGVDGFRADVIHCIGKDPALPDDPARRWPASRTAHLNDEPVTHERLRAIRKLDRRLSRRPDDGRRGLPLLDRRGGHLLRRRRRAPPGLQLPAALRALAAPAVVRLHHARRWRPWTPAGAWPTWVLSNHDNPRPRTRYDRRPRPGAVRPSEVRARRSEARARAAAVLLLTLRGTPFLYQGEELGLSDAGDPRGPRGRPGRSRRLPGADSVDGGPTTAGRPTGRRAVASLPPDADRRNYATCADDRSRSSISTARCSPCDAASRCSPTATSPLDAPDGLLGFRRSLGDRAVARCWSTSPTPPSRSASIRRWLGGARSMRVARRATAWRGRGRSVQRTGGSRTRRSCSGPDRGADRSTGRLVAVRLTRGCDRWSAATRSLPSSRRCPCHRGTWSGRRRGRSGGRSTPVSRSTAPVDAVDGATRCHCGSTGMSRSCRSKSSFDHVPDRRTCVVRIDGHDRALPLCC